MHKFTLKCTSDSFNKKLFPHNGNRGKDVYQVNYARTEQYLNSAIPQCQRLLNSYVKQ